MNNALFKIILLFCLINYSPVVAQEAKPKILAIGDSLLAWHKLTGRSISHIPEFVGFVGLWGVFLFNFRPWLPGG